MIEKRYKFEIEYSLLDKNIFTKNKILGDFNLKTLNEGDFISQIKEKPEGMFRIFNINKENKKIVLEEIDCDPIHWKGDANGRGYGPNNICRDIKKCPYYNECPISVHLMYSADID